MATTNPIRRLAAGTRLVVATHNPGKLREIDELIRPHGLAAIAAGSLGVPEPEETEATFAGNARLKAQHSARATGLPALADDSGLEVAALGGAPGVYSARWAGPAKDFAAAMAEVERQLATKGATSPAHRRANFVAVLCLAWPDGTTELFEGRADGHLVWPPRGGQGFGYDPMFQPDGGVLTFGEMTPAAKHSGSHRARAFQQFAAACL